MPNLPTLGPLKRKKFLPPWDGFPVLHFPESQIFARPELREIDDLPGVGGEVLHDVIKSIQDRNLHPLDLSGFQKLARREGGENPLNLLQSSFQSVQEHRPRSSAFLEKLFIPTPLILCPIDPTHNPLPNVPGQVENQVPYGI